MATSTRSKERNRVQMLDGIEAGRAQLQRTCAPSLQGAHPSVVNRCLRFAGQLTPVLSR